MTVPGRLVAPPRVASRAPAAIRVDINGSQAPSTRTALASATTITRLG
jgi:hypothetical protein